MTDSMADLLPILNKNWEGRNISHWTRPHLDFHQYRNVRVILNVQEIYTRWNIIEEKPSILGSIRLATSDRFLGSLRLWIVRSALR